MLISREFIALQLKGDYCHLLTKLPDFLLPYVWQSLALNYLEVLPDGDIRRILQLRSHQMVFSLRKQLSIPATILGKKKNYIENFIVQIIRENNALRMNLLGNYPYYTPQNMLIIYDVLKKDLTLRKSYTLISKDLEKENIFITRKSLRKIDVAIKKATPK